MSLVLMLQNNIWEIAIGGAILFFILYFLFRKRINLWMTDREDFSINAPSKRIFVAPGTGYKNETRCREIFETIFKRPFKSVRPDFLKRANGKKLELDGYNKDLNLAFEYNGIQHYKFSSKFHRTQQDFDEQQQRDLDKLDMCSKYKADGENALRLITIPYTIKYEKLEGYIRMQLRDMGII